MRIEANVFKLKFGEYILFRDVEHCGTSSAPGTNTHRFLRFRYGIPELHRLGISRNSQESDGIPTNSHQFRNSSSHGCRVIDES